MFCGGAEWFCLLLYPAESLIDYVPHDCDGDKCKFAGCRFTIKLSFVLEKAALVLEGGWRHSAGSSCLAPFPPRGGPCLACLHDVNAHGRT